ncbi:MAG: ABC transporter ATP-binding protein/permease [Bacteriovoracaceae bacterium]|nr:ABC transporter ATP-binding protein/permease [Bacteriovoracaceae bacterium]
MNKRLHRSLSGVLYHQFLEFWPYYVGAIGCLYGTHWIQSHLPFLAKELADIVSEGAERIETWKFFALALGIIVFRTSSRLLFFYPARVLQKNLRVEILEKLEAASPTRYRHHSDGQLFQVLQMDMEQLRALIGFALLQVGNILVAMIVLVPKIISFNENLILALLPLVITFVLFTTIVSRNRVYYRKTQDLQGEVQNVIIETYAGKKTIKNYHAEESFITWFKDYSWKELWYFYKAGIGVGISLPLLPLGIGLSLIWGAHIVFQENLGASSLILFSGFIFLFLEPIMFLSWIGVVFARSYGSWQRIKELVHDIDKSSDEEIRLLSDNLTEDLRGQELDITVNFWDESLKLNFPRGSWSVLVGKTGCGKSTILTQLADILRLRQENISFVAQDPYLYNDTVVNNIFLGQEQTKDRVDQAYELLVLFGLDYLASSKESLLNMEVGEKGKRLSGGQSKRLALVRSLMARADILIWDDPFSSVDLILEKKIIEELKSWQALAGKTIILSSHRVTTVRATQFCLYLEKERGLVEKGISQDLLNPQFETYEYFKQQMV